MSNVSTQIGLYAIFDQGLDSYLSPITDESQKALIRKFKNLVNDEGNLINLNPSDFAVYKVGSFDTSTGVLTAEPEPALIVEAIDLVEKRE